MGCPIVKLQMSIYIYIYIYSWFLYFKDVIYMSKQHPFDISLGIDASMCTTGAAMSRFVSLAESLSIRDVTYVSLNQLNKTYLNRRYKTCANYTWHGILRHICPCFIIRYGLFCMLACNTRMKIIIVSKTVAVLLLFRWRISHIGHYTYVSPCYNVSWYVQCQ